MNTEETRPTIKISQIIKDLEMGVTRFPDSPGYNPDLKSIQEIYGITKKDVTEIFKTPSLKGKRTAIVPTTPYILVNDVEVVPEEEVLEVPN